MSKKPQYIGDQRRLEKALHDAICAGVRIAYGDAVEIDLELIQDPKFKLVVRIFKELYEHPSSQPTAQQIAVEVQLRLENQGYSKEDAENIADSIEDFKGIVPNTKVIGQALKGLRTDTTSPTYLHAVSNQDSPIAYDSLLKLCKESGGSEPLDYESEVVRILNASHSVVLHGSKTLICEKVTDHKGAVNYVFSTPEQKRQFYANLNYSYRQGDQTKRANCFNAWLRHFERKTYHGVVFDPSERAGERFLNMWSGFAVERESGDSGLDRIMRHLLHIICGGNNDHFQFLLAWLAHLVQKPEEKSGICVVLKSDARGTGKSTVSRIINRILGQHATTVQDGKHLLGAFNSHLANKLFVTIEEAFWSGSEKDAGKLRTLITESTIAIEAKGKDALEVDSYHRFMMCTNNDWAVPQTTNERRFFVLEVCDSKAKDASYFRPLYDDIASNLVIGQFLNFLMEFDLSVFDLRKAPKTEAGQQQVWESLKPHEKYVRDLLDFGILNDGIADYDFHEESKVPIVSFFNDYSNYCQKTSAPRSQIIDNARFGKYLRKVLGVSDGGRLTRKGYQSSRPQCYNVPSLESMKERFYRYYEMEV
ncbi:DUF5906 domain-containing protein [Vibrio aestuarianus]|uniref:DUF5906 domain-containing protein n=2 Tax=Vibrio aestuarianus TaxID=28171 RepID=UPI001446A5AA|nr:DUF5906 domain-containing protein [Vibrio aestuarianus]MDE1212678.1 DUF5906 domain-containing protein [Vibrio aestuarianus]MDE1215688.1 DUF5906 domain-containing protein [Vibrio aestuarianus]MDE1226982.1 DUF5906 domain-containing protein [Vibrio aestuarianus]MDE1259790.1 DUF5906 domain-containing protein [Vibrio aestuarianus]MDE1268455.1 DUF5906 domain-containing protein [Vibrio aestuarianus]